MFLATAIGKAEDCCFVLTRWTLRAGARVHLSFFLQITDSDVTEDPTVYISISSQFLR